MCKRRKIVSPGLQAQLGVRVNPGRELRLSDLRFSSWLAQTAPFMMVAALPFSSLACGTGMTVTSS